MLCCSCLSVRYMSGAARGESCPGSPTASGPHSACSGAQSHSHFIAQWGLQTRQWGCDPLHHLAASPFIRLSFSQVPPTIPLSLSSFFFYPSLTSAPPSPFSWGTLSQRGGLSRLGTEGFESPQSFDSMRDNMVNH